MKWYSRLVQLISARSHSVKRQIRSGERRAIRLVAACLAIGIVVVQTATGTERLEGPTWLAKSINGGGVIESVQSTLVFGAGGKVSGSGGCNRLFATAVIAGDRVTFGGIGTTRMACAPAVMSQEQKFLVALASARTFKLEGTLLRLYNGNGAEALLFAELP